ncbi:MAG: S41 family peptidase, partial [Myxococcota bacterium]|nr:S41 family peptidase [Myxococcota bacterium]
MRRTLIAAICAIHLSCFLLAGCKQSVPNEEPKNAAAGKIQGTNLEQQLPKQDTPTKQLSEKPDEDGRISAKEDRLARLLMVLLEERHLRRKPFNDDVSRVAFDAFLESLDPGRLFLLQEDIDALKTYATKIDDEVKDGRFDLAFRGGKRLVRRIKAVREDVADMLQKPFDLEDDSTFQTDSEKRPYARTMEELSVVWRKTLQLQAIRRIDSRLEAQKKSAEPLEKEGQPTSSGRGSGPSPKTTKSNKAGTESVAAPLKSVHDIEVDVRQTLAKRYDARFKRLIQLDAIEHIERLVDAIAEAYDPHTSYLPPARKEDFDIRMSGKLEGIGAVLQEDDDVIKVARIMAGSASDRQGELKAEDYIIAVAQGDEEPTDIVGMRLRDAVRLIRGPKGTTVKLTVRKPDERQIVIPIVRDVVRLEATWARAAILSHKTGGRTGYIELPSFYGSTGQRKPGEKPRTSSGDVRRALETFNDKGVDRVILDLRNNGGGYLTDARRMAGLFIETGPVVQTRTADGELDALVDKNPEVTFDGLAVVMVDHQS